MKINRLFVSKLIHFNTVNILVKEGRTETIFTHVFPKKIQWEVGSRFSFLSQTIQLLKLKSLSMNFKI